MKQKAFLFTNILLAATLGIFPGFAQTKKKINPKKKNVAQTSFESPLEQPIPEIKDFAFVVNIDKNSNVTLKIQKTENTDVLTSASNLKVLKDFFSGVSSSKSPLSPILIVKADSSLNFSDVVNVVKASRISARQKAKIEISKDFYVFVPALPGKTTELKPTPLLLVAELDKNSNLNLNGEELGSVSDTTKLSDFLKQIFQARAENGIYHEGSNELETTVIIKAPSSAKFADIIKIAETLRSAGSTRIGLLIDDFNPLRNVVIEVNRIEL